MVGTAPFVQDPVDTREAIMGATYRALCEHGYADLTIQRIGDQFEKSKSLLYHHYDGKDDLLLEFLEFLLERFEERIPESRIEDPEESLSVAIDFGIPELDSEEAADFVRAMVELRAQATHDEAYRDHFTRNDRLLRERFETIVRAGIASGVFRDVDPEATAAYLQTLVGGAMTYSVTAEDYPAAAVREELDAYIENRLKAPEAREPPAPE